MALSILVRRAWIAGWIGLACLGGARAQSSDPTQLETVTITGTRIPLTLSETGEIVYIIGREEIARMGVASGVDLFRQVPGLQVDQLGGPGGLSSVYIRGSDPNHVLFLIDGVRLNDSTNSRGGGFDISNLDPGLIDRIEVLRGAGSAVYGADAMGGVINIVTRNGLDGTGTQLSGNAGAGGQGYANARVRVSAGEPGLRFSSSASTLKDGSDDRGGRLALMQLALASKWVISRSVSLSVDLRRNERKSSAFPDDSGGIELAQNRTLEQKQSNETIASLRGRWALEGLSLEASAGEYSHVEDINSPGVAPGRRSSFGVPASISHTDYRRSNASVSAVVSLNKTVELALGSEFQREQGVGRTVYTIFGSPFPADFDLSRDTRSMFAEVKVTPVEDLIVRAGARHDDVQGNGSHDSPSLSLRYNLPLLESGIRANYSEGFKAASFFALGLPVALGGNPNLRAEHSKVGAISYEQTLAARRANVGITLFKTRYTDLVTFDNQTNQIVNANGVNVHGAEFEGLLKATSSLTIQAHFTRLYSRVVDSDEPLRQRPVRRSGIQVSWSPQQALTLNWRTEYTASTFDSSIPTGNLTLPMYLRNDVSFAWTWRKDSTFSAAVENMFDRRNENYIGAVAPGRRFRAAVSIAL